MNKREKAILSDLKRFRCMARDDIADIHFSHTNHPIKNTNDVLKRMRRDGHIDANVTVQPYIYFPTDSAMKRNSQKIDHFLAIVSVYRELRRKGAIKIFEVEPKFGSKGTVEPDVFTVITIGGTPIPMFIEVQNSIYTQKTMQEKIDRYESYFRSNEWRESWRGFPNLILLSETPYNVHSELLKVWQYKNVTEFLRQHSKPAQKAKPQPQSGIVIKAGSTNLTMK